jgi:dihydroneopterin aldolase
MNKSDETNFDSPLGARGYSIITLKNMEFHAYHGCLEHEKQLGNTFIVNLTMELDTTKAGKSDELEDTLNYQLVYDKVKEQMLVPSRLIEHAGQRIVDAVFENFKQLISVEVKLTKLNPPLGGKVESVSVWLRRNR